MRLLARMVCAVALLSGTVMPSAAQETAGPPRNLRAQVSGASVLIEWDGPPQTSSETYEVVAALTPGGPPAASFLVLERHELRVDGAPPGVFYLRVYALYTVQGVGVAEVSNEIQIVVGSGCAAPPDAPVGLDYFLGVGGVPNQVNLEWGAPPAGCTATGYQVLAGSAPGASNIAVFPVPQNQHWFAAIGPPGRYFVRVRAVNGYGAGAPTGDAQIDIPGSCGPTPPGPPGPLTATVGAATVGGKEVRMDWSAPVGGDPVAFYQLLVGLQPGHTFLTLTTADTFTQYGGAPPGVYYLRVRGQDVCGRNGPTSNEFRFVVP